MPILLFNKWDMAAVKVSDQGLARYLNVQPIMVPRTGGKYAGSPLTRQKMSVVERFMNKLMVAGHRGKKHRITSGRNVGNSTGLFTAVEAAFDIIHTKTGQNPAQVLVTAIENAALLEEIASYRLGGMIARRSVVTSPSRRLDMALRHLTQGINKLSFRSKTKLPEAIAAELIAAMNNDAKGSFAVSERQRLEREAEGAR